jgi:hypothetical protein
VSLYCMASAFKSQDDLVALDLGCKRRISATHECL